MDNNEKRTMKERSSQKSLEDRKCEEKKCKTGGEISSPLNYQNSKKMSQMIARCEKNCGIYYKTYSKSTEAMITSKD